MTCLSETAVGGPELRYPIATLNLADVKHNIAQLDRYCAEHGIVIAPHAKTTMIGRVLELLVEQPSTWGLTVADAQQGAVAVEAGARRILVANQLVEPQDIAWASIHRTSGTEVLSFVDSPAGVAWLDRRLEQFEAGSRVPGRRHRVLLEVGYVGGRGGVRSWRDFDAVVDAVRNSRCLALTGVAAFEGLLGGSATAPEVRGVDDFLRRLNIAAQRLVSMGGVAGSELIVSAGGSAYFDRVAEICGPAVNRLAGTLLLRSGCYAVHDHGLYARTSPTGRTEVAPKLRPAAVLWARVQSRPEPGRVIVAAGRRHVPFDAGLPIPLGTRYRDGTAHHLPPGCQVDALSDQHLHLQVPDACDLVVGDVLPFGVSHPCGLFDRWREVVLVDADRNVTGVVAPRF
ncbi:alanine racemase [Kribbella sp. NPDC048915]|uniref:alanine racemase n=1 Tax=Kribbella sp. NPDC048915 TaxID=3155148 RepID=UPI0033CD0CC2